MATSKVPMSQNTKKEVKSPTLLLIAIFCCFFSQSEFMLLTPAIESISAAFPDIPFSTILVANNITGLAAMAVSFVAGFLYERVGYKKLAVAGLTISMVSGCFPYFLPSIDSFAIVIVSRTLVGVGLGFINPVGAALLMRFYDGENRTRLLAIGNAVFMGSGIVFTALGGYLCDISWEASFLGYLVMIVPLAIIIIWLKDPVLFNQKTDKQSGDDAPKSRIPAIVWALMLVYIIGHVSVLGFVQMTSSVVADNNLGTASTAAWINNADQIAGIISGLIFGYMLKVFKRFTNPVIFLVMGIGFGIAVFSLSVPGQAVAAFLIGMGYTAITTYCQSRIAVYCPPDRLGWCNGFLQTMMQFGTFLGSYWMAANIMMFPDYGSTAPRLVSMIVYFVVAAILFVVMAKMTDWSNSSSDRASENES